jgi:hypothetical protein
MMNPPAETEKLRSWTPAACLIPWVGVPVVFAASYGLDHWIIRCLGRPAATCDDRPLRILTTALEALNLRAGVNESIRLTYDLAARFTWHPTFVAFLVVAIGTILACAYLIDGSLDQSLPNYQAKGRPWSIGGLAAGAVVVGLVGYYRFAPWILHTGILMPILESATDASGVRVAKEVQQVFQSLAFIGSAMVVAAAGAALLTPIRAHGEADEEQFRIRHLTDQWRRLSFTLFAGAALLVTAVVYQTSLYAWADSFAKAVVATRDAQTHAAAAKLGQAQAELAFAQARLVRDTAKPGGKETPAWKARLDSSQVLVSQAEFRLATVTREVAMDSTATGMRVRELGATMTRVSELTTTAITRGSGLVYTILLAMTYLPAALVLMERARELSYAQPDAGANDAERATWRTNQGIAFSLGTQWSKAIAVLSPLIASGGAAYLFNLLR